MIKYQYYLFLSAQAHVWVVYSWFLSKYLLVFSILIC